MPRKGSPPRGVVAVGLMAMHNRAFFKRLLADPRRALTVKVRGDLGLTAADVNRVAKLVVASRAKMSPADGMKAWDRWRKTGMVGPIWPTSIWPIQ